MDNFYSRAHGTGDIGPPPRPSKILVRYQKGIDAALPGPERRTGRPSRSEAISRCMTYISFWRADLHVISTTSAMLIARLFYVV